MLPFKSYRSGSGQVLPQVIILSVASSPSSPPTPPLASSCVTPAVHAAETRDLTLVVVVLSCLLQGPDGRRKREGHICKDYRANMIRSLKHHRLCMNRVTQAFLLTTLHQRPFLALRRSPRHRESSAADPSCRH